MENVQQCDQSKTFKRIFIILEEKRYDYGLNHSILSNQRMLKGHNTQHRVNNFQNELMFDIYSKILVRAIGKVLCIVFS